MLNVKLSIDDVDQDLLVVAYKYRDELSQPFELEIEALFAESALDFEALLGAPTRARFLDEPFMPAVYGIIYEMEQLTKDVRGRSHYRIRIVPPFALLAHRIGHRIEQDKSLIDIAKAVAASCGEAPELKLSQTYPPREYTVQYGEADLAFAQRMLAEAGVGFFYDHGAKSVLTLFDDLSAAIQTKANVPYRPEEGRIEGEPHVHFTNTSARLRPGRVSLSDYDYERPQLDLSGEQQPGASRKIEPALELFEVEIGDPKNEGQTKQLARRILEGLRVRATTSEIHSSFALPAGSELILRDAPRPDLAEPLVVLSSETSIRKFEGEQNTYSRITVIPKKVAFRPARVPKPRIWGTQTAFVVGERGEEIDVDDQGRVKVVFHWDRRGIRDGAPTRRIRVSQAWAGPGYGLMTIPRIGDEVVVSYLDGDPDEPLIVGRVHNKKAPPPLQLPAQKTQSIWKSKSTPGAEGANHILLEDQAGEELLELSGQRDVHVHANRNYSRTVGQDETRVIGGHSEEDIKSYHNFHVGGPEMIKIDGPQSVSIGPMQTIDVAGVQMTTVGGHQGMKSAMMSVESGPIGITGTTITTTGSAEIGSAAPVIAMDASAMLSGTAPQITLDATTTATIHAPIATITGDGIAALGSLGSTTVMGTTITISGGSSIDIGAGGTIIVSAAKVAVNGAAQVDVSAAGMVNISGTGAVNVTGGSVNIN
ncbi:MAG: type VI secretion system tip protein VgrG [Polyangiaceae bacterium]|nr:type VI secretion system tip protein VgrG [Polyangiaceae bacterium]